MIPSASHQCPLSGGPASVWYWRRRLAEALLREQQRDDGPDAQSTRAALRAGCPVAQATAHAHELAAHLRHLRDEGMDRHGPLLVLPVVRALRVECEGPGPGRGIRQEGLQKRQADVRTIVIARKRPEMVAQRAVGPSVLLLEYDYFESKTTYVLVKHLIE